jgi:hypothetical protein
MADLGLDPESYDELLSTTQARFSELATRYDVE